MPCLRHLLTTSAMRSDPTKELRRFFGQAAETRKGNPGAPWWARWLTEAAVTVVVIFAVAVGIDGVATWAGGAPFALCWVYGLTDGLLQAIEPLGYLVLLGGALYLILGGRRRAVAALAAGLLLSIAPDLYTGLMTSCAS